MLPNGLTLLVKREESAPVAAVITHVKAGFFDEPDHWVGISHVLEHMFFKGTARRGVGAIARETKAAGGYLNASTTYDHTTYFTVLPASSLETALDIQADALRNSLIDADELARELQVIIQEARRKLDHPGVVTHETLHGVMFDRHRIRRWRIGHESQLAHFTRDDLWAYYRSRYVPERTVVSLVGALDEDRVLALARAAYGDWPASPPAVDPSPDEPPRCEVRTRTLRGDVSQSELALGWRSVPPLHPDSAALDLIAALLALGRGSALYQSLREPGVVTGVSAHNHAPTELGVFSISADFDPDRLSAVIAGVAEEVTRLAMLGPSPDALERAKTLLLTRWARRMEPMDGRASSLASAEALRDIRLLDEEYQEIASLNAEEIRNAAARYLRPDAVSAVAYHPRDRGVDLSVGEVEKAFDLTRLRATATVRRVPAAPRPTRPTRGSETAAVRHTALAGVDLLVHHKPGVPTVTLGIYLPRNEPDPPSQAGLAALAVRSCIRGAGGLNGAELAFAFEGLGGTVSSATAADWSGVGTTVLSEKLGAAAALLRRVLAEPDLAEDEIARERSLMIEEARQLADDMFRYPFQLALAAAFGDSGYGLPTVGLPDTLPRITTTDVREWQATMLRRHRLAIVAVGDLDSARASDELAGIFDAEPARSSLEDLSPAGWALNGGPVIREATREKAQSALAMVFRGPARRDRQRHVAEVWAAVASGLGGRLFEALRDRRSLAYTVIASSWQKRRAGALLTYIATSPEREDEAREAMLTELARFAREEVSPAELHQAVNYLSGQAAVRRQTAVAVAAEILEAWLTGEGLEELIDPGARYRRVTASEVQEMAERCLRSDQRAEGVVRGTSIDR